MDPRQRMKADISTAGRLLFKALCGEDGEFEEELHTIEARPTRMGLVQCRRCGLQARVPMDMDVRTVLPNWMFSGGANNALCDSCKRYR